MGNWKNRPFRRSFRRPRSPPRSYYELESSNYDFGDDGVPAWEKRFCALIGSVPWRKVVDAKKFMSCNRNVLNWDDAAGEEAFKNAKNRFWSEMNGLPCNISLPDPDMYIDKVDWETVIDPELIKDLEREYFSLPGEGQIDFKSGRKSKRTRNSKTVPWEECDQKEETVNNQWERENDAPRKDLSRNNGTHRLGQLDSSVNNSLKDSNNAENLWETKPTPGVEIANNTTWGDGSGKGWDSRGDNSWGLKWQDSSKLNYGYNNPRQHGFVPDDGTRRDKGWVDGRANARWSETRGTNNTEQRKWEVKRSTEGWGGAIGGSLKRGSTHDWYASGYRSSRFKRDDNQTGSDWRSARGNRRVSFALK